MSGSSFESLRAWNRVALAAACGLVGGVLAALPAAAAPGQQSVDMTPPESATQFYLFPGVPRITLSNHGNVLRYEGPTGYDHVGIGQLSEGYVLCWNNGSQRVWDTGSSEFGFGPSNASCSNNTCTVTRNTSDGRFRLRQVFVKSTTERSLDVEMTLTNISNSTISGIVLRRQVDFDVDTGGPQGSGNFNNWWGATERDSVFAWNPANATAREGHSMVLRQLRRTPNTVGYTAKVTADILDTSCNPFNEAADQPVFGDYGGTIQYNIFSLARGASFVGRLQYERN